MQTSAVRCDAMRWPGDRLVTEKIDRFDGDSETALTRTEHLQMSRRTERDEKDEPHNAMCFKLISRRALGMTFMCGADGN